jgi:hypothetical protein
MNATRVNHARIRNFGVAVVYFYVVLAGLIIAVNAARSADYLGILFGAASLLVVVVLHRMLKR